MKKVLCLVCLLVFSASTVFAEEFDFRKTKWGMTHDQVAKSEKVSPKKTHRETLAVPVNIFGTKGTLTYYFDNDSLYAAKMWFVIIGADAKNFLYKVDKAVSTKYTILPLFNIWQSIASVEKDGDPNLVVAYENKSSTFVAYTKNEQNSVANFLTLICYDNKRERMVIDKYIDKKLEDIKEHKKSLIENSRESKDKYKQDALNF